MMSGKHALRKEFLLALLWFQLRSCSRISTSNG
jgi:hypothetical protein